MRESFVEIVSSEHRHAEETLNRFEGRYESKFVPSPLLEVTFLHEPPGCLPTIMLVMGVIEGAGHEPRKELPALAEMHEGSCEPQGKRQRWKIPRKMLYVMKLKTIS